MSKAIARNMGFGKPTWTKTHETIFSSLNPRAHQVREAREEKEAISKIYF